ncbi:MAG TPA: AgmX/PglI C-terminal domain-containing protein [Polyangiaceae bacterium LLY-WYZ-15_(1-7)]|nr:hypothetical protein [Myxococcales bacterium]MAT26662.1 hypothetical protein [Sandaracinus sp.]HJK92225.1 AgmX/PglI C-terminal domain-containing protein [Polyangiaceae bacterium LLY-WYZ-15_(1-7)]HJL02542.1 AgmX/PglI C-terminal domain-containing protein [Polyangiaceae bacterium LLY-WYZ-15_(1-7)]HJL13146.1 AgmX/PglI C-terminal domain-containing protein [Polyangiaceae bacterium LLY-WYZ-15_(1-7)]
MLARLRFERRQGPPRVEVRVELRRPPTAIGGLAGAGGLGLRGTGRGGGGTGEGTLGLGSRGRGEGGDEGAAERVGFGRVEVRGPLPREAVRRVLRRHERELRHCYATARREQPELAGRLLVEFEIGPQGRVGSARVTENGLGHAALAQCVVRRLRRWRFPHPDVGGTVRVRSPFVFATVRRRGAPPDAEARPPREEDATPPSRPRGQLAPARPTIRGALSREVIQRVVRQHANEARYCYERRLGEHPRLAGRLVLRFVISPEGRVASASVDEDTLGDAAVGACLAHAVRRWRFPRPSGGGIVLVRYPFVFRPG